MNRITLSLFVALALSESIAPRADAADAPVITRVEEDWRVYVVEPDSNSGVPHIANFIAPSSSDQSVFGIVELNHGSQPDFVKGGCQVQGWVNDTLASLAETDNTNRLSLKYDRVEYTVSLALTANAVQIALSKGKSKSWGRFATTPIVASVPVLNPSLADYDPNVSVANTSINHGANRVALMYMMATRSYSGETLVSEDRTPRILHRFHDMIQYVSLEEYEQNPDFYNISIDE